MDLDETFTGIAQDLAPLGVKDGRIFSSRALMVDGKAIACLKDGAMAFKLGRGTPEHQRALSLPGAAPFDPSGRHRPYKDWVAVPADEHAEWSSLAEAALLARRADGG